MPGVLQLAIAFLPGLMWLWWIHRKDDWEPEPQTRVLLVFALGALSAIVIVLTRPTFEEWLPGYGRPARQWIDVFLVTALAEEMAKLGALLAGAGWAREWDEPLDGIVYGAAAGLGFASVENAFYLASAGSIGIVIARAFTSTLLHVVCTSTVGFLGGLGKLHGRLLLGLAAGLFMSAVAHGAYDLFLFVMPRWSQVSLLVELPALLVVFALAVRWSRARSPGWHPRGAPDRQLRS